MVLPGSCRIFFFISGPLLKCCPHERTCPFTTHPRDEISHSFLMHTDTAGCNACISVSTGFPAAIFSGPALTPRRRAQAITGSSKIPEWGTKKLDTKSLPLPGSGTIPPWEGRRESNVMSGQSERISCGFSRMTRTSTGNNLRGKI